jgi:hypothetical protein
MNNDGTNENKNDFSSTEHGQELARLFTDLGSALQRMRPEMSADEARALDEKLDAMKAEARKPEPDHGLLKTATDELVADVEKARVLAEPAISTAYSILRLFGVA